MADTTRPPIEEYKALADAATADPIVRVRYDHGGGRAYAERSGGRDLVLDVYNQGDRDFYFSARDAVPALCEYVLRLEEALSKSVCAACGGDGSGAWSDVEGPCPACGGSGKVAP